MRQKKANHEVRLGRQHTLESDVFVEMEVQHILEDENMTKSFSLHSKRNLLYKKEWKVGELQ